MIHSEEEGPEPLPAMPKYVSIVLHVCRVDSVPMTPAMSKEFSSGGVRRKKGDARPWVSILAGSMLEMRSHSSELDDGHLLVVTNSSHVTRITPLAHLALDVDAGAKFGDVVKMLKDAIREGLASVCDYVADGFYGQAFEFGLRREAQSFPVMEIACVNLTSSMRFIPERIYLTTGAFTYNIYAYTRPDAPAVFVDFIERVRDEREAIENDAPPTHHIPMYPGTFN